MLPSRAALLIPLVLALACKESMRGTWLAETGRPDECPSCVDQWIVRVTVERGGELSGWMCYTGHGAIDIVGWDTTFIGRRTPDDSLFVDFGGAKQHAILTGLFQARNQRIVAIPDVAPYGRQSELTFRRDTIPCPN